MSRRALLVGATGLVGRQLLALLLADPDYGQVHVWVRRPLGRAHAKLVEHLVDFEVIASQRQAAEFRRTAERDAPDVDTVFCCLGTTIKVAGSQAAFRRVDHDYVLAVARTAFEAGATRCVLVSAMGADSSSRVFYSRVKGDIEAAVSEIGFRSVSILRPSFLAGERAEHRPGEKLALRVLSPLSFLIPGKFRPISDHAVARAMIDTDRRAQAGVEIIESDRIQAFA